MSNVKETADWKMYRQFISLYGDIAKCIKPTDIYNIAVKVALFGHENDGVVIESRDPNFPDYTCSRMENCLWDALEIRKQQMLRESDEVRDMLDEINRFANVKIILPCER